MSARKSPTTRSAAATPSASVDVDRATGDASSPDKVVETIYRGIVKGSYVPGQKLIEADLMQALGVSRGPIREALKRLDAQGVVKLTRHRGAYIRQLTRQETADFLEILEVLTALIARKAAAAAARDDRSAALVREAFHWLENFRDPGQEDLAFLEHRGQFYDTLITIGGNSLIRAMMPLMRIRLLRLQAQPYLTRDDRMHRVNEYAVITRAVLAGDEAAAQRATRQHMKQMQKRFARLPDEAFASEG